MNVYVFKDNSIEEKQYQKWQQDFTSFIGMYTGAKPMFHTDDMDFSFYPTYKDSDGDLRPDTKWLKGLVSAHVEKHSPYQYDHVFLFINIDNWRSGGDLYRKLIGDPKAKGIWGTNFSYIHGNCHVHYCRWDNRNSANSFGTAYHEWMHSIDALVRVETGKTVKPGAWDRMVHGLDGYEYIRYKENAYELEVNGPLIKEAYEARRQKQKDEMKQKVGLLQTILLLTRRLRELTNRKNGVSA